MELSIALLQDKWIIVDAEPTGKSMPPGYLVVHLVGSVVIGKSEGWSKKSITKKRKRYLNYLAPCIIIDTTPYMMGIAHLSLGDSW